MNGQPRSITTNSITLGAAIRAFEDICNDPPTPKAFGDSVRNAEWAKDYIKAISDSLDNKNLKGDLLKKARILGKEIHTRSVFLQGLFFKPIEEFQDKFLPLVNDVLTIQQLAIENNISIASLALNYNLQQDYIDKILIGVDTFDQLVYNLSLINEDVKVTNQIDSNVFVKNINLLNPVNW